MSFPTKQVLFAAAVAYLAMFLGHVWIGPGIGAVIGLLVGGGVGYIVGLRLWGQQEARR